LDIPFGTLITPQHTTQIPLPHNLNAGTPVGGTVTTTVTVYDSLGNPHSVRIEFEKDAAPNTWNVTAYYDDDGDSSTAPVSVTPTPAQLVFDNTTGALTTPSDGNLQFSLGTLPTDAATPLDFTVNFLGVTQFGGQSQLTMTNQNGFPAGTLVSFAVGSSGEISGIYSNGANRIIGQIALANFVNPGGLQRAGQNLWSPSSASGDPIIGPPNTGGRGVVQTGTLEASNVDLAQQFTNMILAQRGFQANSRVITATDQMLQDLVNIIR